MKGLFILMTLVWSIDSIYGQTNDSTNFEAPPTSIDEVVKQLGSDTVVFYYNVRWQLVRPICATIFRVTRFDPSLAMFTGKFTDYYATDSTKAIEGNYSNGKKEGNFSIYFPNGQLEQSGNFVNNKKSGTWEYFYEDGKNRQILDFREGEVLVNDFWNEEGKKSVVSGNGEWFTYESAEKFMKTSGGVLNGRKNGTWKNTITSSKMITNIEKYREGKFVSGKMISIVGGTESYKDTLYCSIERYQHFLTAEKFEMNRCFKYQTNNWEFAKYPGGMTRFYKEIREKIVLTGPVLKRGMIRVQTTIDTAGVMMNFKPVSDIGYEFDLIRVLETMDRWIPTKINGKPTIQPKIISLEVR